MCCLLSIHPSFGPILNSKLNHLRLKENYSVVVVHYTKDSIQLSEERLNSSETVLSEMEEFMFHLGKCREGLGPTVCFVSKCGWWSDS